MAGACLHLQALGSQTSLRPFTLGAIAVSGMEAMIQHRGLGLIFEVHVSWTRRPLLCCNDRT